MSDLTPDAPASDAPVAEETPAVVASEAEVPASNSAESLVPASDAPETPAVATDTPAAEVEDPFAAYGGKEAIEAAHRMYEASRTDDGVIQLFLEAGQALGLGLKELQTLFADLGGEVPEEPDPDEPITRKEFQETLTKQKQAEAERQQARVQQAAAVAVQETVSSLGLDPKDPTTTLVLQLADKHMKDDFSAEAISAAIRQGHADYQAQVEKAAQAYLTKKAATAAAVPQAPAGNAAPAEAAPAEPKNVTEAIAQVRQRLAAVGRR